MKKTLARIEIVLTDEKHGDEPGSFTETRMDPEKGDLFIVTLNPKADATMIKRLLHRDYPLSEQVKTILAHELGHVVEIVSRDPAHHPVVGAMFGELLGEQHAWKIAEKISPDLAKPVEAAALADYAIGD